MTWPWRITWLYLSVILLLPVAALCAKALSLPPAEIWRIATEPIALSAFRVTLTTALAAALTNGVAGLAIAWTLTRYRFPGRLLLDAALDLPLAMPAVVSGLTLVTVYGDRGWLGALLLPLGIQVPYSRWGVYMAMLFSSLPFGVRTVQPVLAGLDPVLEQAAQSMGASPWRCFREVLLPLLLPGLLTGISLGFARAVGEYGAVVLMASNLPFRDLIAAVLIMQRLEQYDIAGAAVLGLVLLLFALILLGLINWLQTWSQRTSSKGFIRFCPSVSQSYTQQFVRDDALPDWGQPSLNKVKRLLLLGLVLAYLAVVLLLPTANLLFQALGFGIAPLLDLLSQREFWAALRLTITIATIALLLNTTVGLCIAWAIAHHHQQTQLSSRLLLSLIDLPLSISPVVVGLMIVLLYGRGGWFGRLLAAGQIRIVFALPGMALAAIFITLPFVLRAVLPVWQAMGNRQEEAARSLGASDLTIFRRLILPQIRSSLGSGMVLTFARAMGDFGAVMVVSGGIIGKTQTLSLYIEDSYKNYEPQIAYVAALVLVSLTLAIAGLRQLSDRLKS